MAKAVTIDRSHRMDGIGEYYFSRRLREIAETEAATGRQIVKLAMGSPDLPPHPAVIERLAREAQRPDVHKYMSFQGEPILRKAFADWYARWYGVELDYRSEVYPLIGSKEGIMHICMTFLNPGDKVLVPDPGYPTYSAAVRLSGGVMVPYALNKQTDFYPDFEAIERAGLDGVKIMLVNYPNMPTGQVPTRELFERIVDFGARHNILIVHDNPYSFIRNAEAPMSIFAVEGARDVALEMNSLSKGHSMAGWRVGMVAGRAEWIRAILSFKSNMDTGMFYPIQAAAETALSLGREWFDELNAIYYRRERQAYALLDALGCRYRPRQAGLFVWAELPEGYEGDSFSFSDEVLEQCDVFLTPGGIFGSEGNGYVRITLCCPEELLKRATDNVVARYRR
ncbi:pyridoxal phosphate-dependent aminotransferase [Alistipes sp.]|uniref:pyridoxal phosphate-dependent aminotransferase n=1 Tax=Alistipes sp. TaxID=1872444 RepID=UPI000E98354E|nr:aminotransferase class I/II-fold pyridoxal phosphate-dependent enzyme [Alistipes sp.]HBX90583.1 LL-diaminopimelate aminotransferase [Alistipes sp.]